MADINTGKITRFEDGSSFTITPAGGAALVLKNIVGGTFGFTPPVRETLEPDIDRGELLDDVREGDEQPGTLDVDTKATADQGSTEFFELLTAASADGYVPNMEIVIDVPDFTGAATGVRWTFTKAVRREAPSFTSGEHHDTIIGRWLFTSHTKAAY